MPPSDQSIWSDVLSFLRTNRADICRQWFEDITPQGVVAGVYYFRLDHPVRRQYLQRHCVEAFTEAVQAVTGRLFSARFIGPGEFPVQELVNGHARGSRPASPSASHTSTHNGSAPPVIVPSTAGAPLDSLALNPDFSFEHFVVGPENRLAHAAALAVAHRPGSTYNPLFVYGGVGLGKTHLLQAICQRVMTSHPGLAVRYVSCESFMTHLRDAVQDGRLVEFRQQFRDVGLLVIDDIQFLAKRDSTQEQFFHTFNVLHQAERQIVLSSDNAPHEIPELEARLVSRFQSGLVVSVNPPGYETRVQIVKQKARIRGIEIPEDVACFIAGRMHASVRELEGAIVSLHMLAQTDARPISLALARAALGNDRSGAPPEVTITGIIDVVVNHFGVKLTDLQSKRRQKSIAHPRQVCMYFARRHTRYSYEEIGGYFGGRDHTTVMHAVRTIDERRSRDIEFDRVLTALEQRIRPEQP